ncbi:MAG: hypothetical protein MZW92_11205 [Comamonadaceae bacterium]|nr:hypothetical protein [Comamonadaceae bacterium]
MRYKHPQARENRGRASQLCAGGGGGAGIVRHAQPVRARSPELAELLRQMRIAQAQGQPTDDLRRAFHDAVARFRGDSKPLAAQVGSARPPAGRRGRS